MIDANKTPSSPSLHISNIMTHVLPIHAKASESDDENSADANVVEEWAMLELNGELIMPTVIPAPRQHNSNADMKENDHYRLLGADGVELGSLQFRNKTTPVLIVGSHELKGTFQTLPNPFGVLQKVFESQPSTDGESPVQQQVVSYRLVGVVKQKILFNGYPKSILR